MKTSGPPCVFMLVIVVSARFMDEADEEFTRVEEDDDNTVSSEILIALV